METEQTFRKLVLLYPGVIESPHFEKTSFRSNNKIFATWDAGKKLACVKLNEIDQSVFCKIDSNIIYPVNNKWGKQGWTIIEPGKIKPALLKDLLSKAFTEVNQKKKNSKTKLL